VSEPVGVILAAGLATRMGRPKQLLPFRDSTVLGSVIEAALASQLKRVLLVVGSYADEILAKVDTVPIEVVHNPAPEQGNLSSLLAAVEVVGPVPILLLVGDIPAVTSGLINAHLERFSEDTWLTVTRYSDGRGHPYLLAGEVVEMLGGLHGPKPLWALSQTDLADTLVVDSPMPVDVDTPEDYEEAITRDAADP